MLFRSPGLVEHQVEELLFLLEANPLAVDGDDIGGGDRMARVGGPAVYGDSARPDIFLRLAAGKDSVVA